MPPHAAPGDVTTLISLASTGDEAALSSLFDVLYRELRRLAASTMQRERREHTLQPTALVHEAYARLLGSDTPIENRQHFFGVAAVAMRRILVEHARARGARKRGGGAARVDIHDVDLPAPGPLDSLDIDALDQALTRLSTLDARQGRVVELRFFAGLSVEETADVLGVSPRTVKREWQVSRAWLRREMSKMADRPSP